MASAKFYYRDPNAPKPNRPIGVGALALIERDGALLLERRSDAGRWGLVGGAIDLEESLGAALRREVWEETGLVVSDYTLFCIFSDPSRRVHYPDGNVVRPIAFVYNAEVESFDTLRGSAESIELRFFRRDDLPGLDVVETMRPIVDLFLAAPRALPVILE